MCTYTVFCASGWNVKWGPCHCGYHFGRAQLGTRSRTPLYLTAIALFVVDAGCSTDASSPSNPDATYATTSAAAHPKDGATEYNAQSSNPCDWISADEVSDIIGETILQTSPSPPGVAANISGCAWVLSSSTMTASWTTGTDVDTAKSDMTSLKGNQTVSPVDIGDEGWCTDSFHNTAGSLRVSYIAVRSGANTWASGGRTDVVNCEELVKMTETIAQRKGF
jgi:hypothetical protein